MRALISIRRPNEGNEHQIDSCARRTAKPRSVARDAIALATSLCIFAAVAISAGCRTAIEHLSFPTSPIEHTADADWYDVNHDGKPDFGVLRDSSGKVNVLEYDDDEDGKPDRIYRLSDYANDSVPHFILLLDSVPFDEVAKRYDAGEFGWFDPPQKVISVFPSLTEQVFTRILDAPPLAGMIDDSYDTRTGRSHMGITERIGGYHQPWEYRCNYCADYWRGAASYLDPRGLFYDEMALSRRALDESPDRVTVCYVTSASSMICKYGKPGCDEVLDETRRLCLQLLYERCGAVKISVCADHGHNFMRLNERAVRRRAEAGGISHHQCDSQRSRRGDRCGWAGDVSWFAHTQARGSRRCSVAAQRS